MGVEEEHVTQLLSDESCTYPNRMGRILIEHPHNGCKNRTVANLKPSQDKSNTDCVITAMGARTSSQCSKHVRVH